MSIFWKSSGATVLLALIFVLLAALQWRTEPVRPAAAAGGIILLEVSDTQEPIEGQDVRFEVDGDCAMNGVHVDQDDDVELDQNQNVSIVCASNGIVTIELEPEWQILSGLDMDPPCSVLIAGTFPDFQSEVVSVQPNLITIDLRDDEHVTCHLSLRGNPITPTPTPTVTRPPTATATATATAGPMTLTVSLSPPEVECGDTAFVTVIARDASGTNVAAGPVTLATDGGNLNPDSATDIGAGVLSVYTAPQGAGNFTVVATAQNATGTAPVTVTCAAATPVPPTAVPQTGGGTGIRPPNTGEGGLRAD